MRPMLLAFSYVIMSDKFWRIRKGKLQQCPCRRRVRHGLGDPFSITISISHSTVYMVE